MLKFLGKSLGHDIIKRCFTIEVIYITITLKATMYGIVTIISLQARLQINTAYYNKSTSLDLTGQQHI